LGLKIMQGTSSGRHGILPVPADGMAEVKEALNEHNTDKA
jgi:hypothetical protein